ncbi:MAG: AAA family ATPase [Candidatus Sericytochromatia bacterium]
MSNLDKKEPAYQLFQTWIEKFVLQHQSILTADGPVCLSAQVLHRLQERFIINAKEGQESFKDKLKAQLIGATPEERHLFAQAHWLWFMGIMDIHIPTKKAQISEILDCPSEELQEEVFIQGYQKGGTYHKQNKYAEIAALLNIFDVILEFQNLGQLQSAQEVRELIEQICLFGLRVVSPVDVVRLALFQTKIPQKTLAIYNILLHLAKPKGYEPIVAENQKLEITEAFRVLIKTPSAHIEQQLAEIRAQLETIPRFSEFTFSDHPEIRAIWQEKNQQDKLQKIYDELNQATALPGITEAELEQLVKDLTTGQRNAWLIKPGEKARHWESCLRDQNIRFGWDQTLAHYFLEPSMDEKKLKEIMRIADPVYSTKNPSKSAKTILNFIQALQVGDVLIAASGRSQLIGVGLVSGPPLWKDNYAEYKTCREVDWRINLVANPLPVEEIQHKIKMLPMETFMKIESAEEAIEILQHMQLRRLGKLDRKAQMPVNHPLNQILYGPPGTGKTWQTIQYALAILEDKTLSALAEESRADLIRRFKQYQQTGQIAFVTFHANYAYEDFVQGLRPMLQTQGQLAFELKDGIFKELADEAKHNYLALQSTVSGKPDFRTVFESFMAPLLVGDEEEMSVPMKQKDSCFFITEITSKSIKTRKQRGSSEHSLSINTLEHIYNHQPETWKAGGLTPYYRPLLGHLQQHATEMQVHPSGPSEKEPVISKNYVLIIDEINRANLSRVFGELITLLEPDKRLGAENEVMMTLPSGDSFYLPPNLYLIGTMNTADKSIALVDIALRRRFHFVPVYPDPELIPDPNWKRAFEQLNRLIRERKGADFQIGHAYFLNEQSLESILNNKVIPLLQEYFLNDIRTVRSLLAEVGWQTEETSWGGLKYLNG